MTPKVEGGWGTSLLYKNSMSPWHSVPLQTMFTNIQVHMARYSADMRRANRQSEPNDIKI